MSVKFPLGNKPAAGTIIGRQWKYTTVSVSPDTWGKTPCWFVFTGSKFKTYEQAKAHCDEFNGRTGREYFVAEWTQDEDGEIICVLHEDP